MSRKFGMCSAIILTLLAVAVLASALSADQTIKLRSGEGANFDDNVNMLVGPVDTEFGMLTPQDFQNARTGGDAYILASPHRNWVSSLTMDSNAHWISTSSTGVTAGNSALYAIDFQITDTQLESAAFSMWYSVDNTLGGQNNEGVFLNGIGISGSATGDYRYPYKCGRDDVLSLLHPGLNTLYINASNGGGGPAGLIFSATISTVGNSNAVPEPASLLALGSGLVGIAGFAVRRRK